MSAFDLNKIAQSQSGLKGQAGTGFSNPFKSGGSFELLNPANARRAISGLMPGGGLGLDKLIPNIGFGFGGAGGKLSGKSGGATAAIEDDWRVRIGLADRANYLYKENSPSSLLSPLKETNGVVWPYTPTINVSHVANYSTAALTHSNYPQHFYNQSEVADITISGEFTVQSKEEGQYLMAAIYFFRAATKMFFGQGQNIGNPPPMVYLDGYGSHYFPHVPGVITNFTHVLPNDVDYIEVPVSVTTLEESVATPNQGAGETYPTLLDSSQEGTGKVQNYKTVSSNTRLPTSSTVTVTFRPVYSRKNVAERFSLTDFAEGRLIQDKDKGFGGFI